METKEFLKQALESFKKAENDIESGRASARSSKNETLLDTANNTLIGNDPVLVGKILFHTERLSDQATELRKKMEALEKEIGQLKDTLKALKK
jgi:hypothetical protein